MTSPAMPPTAPPPAPRGSDRFFLWVAGLGVARSDGWIGGVCAGIASRWRVDPLIVRGLIVVATLIGLPTILLYAIAWALLPDAEGRIHLRELLRGRFEAAQLGILAMLIIAVLPTPNLFDWLVPSFVSFLRNGYYGYGAPLWNGFTLFLFFVGLALALVLLVLIVRAARRTPGISAPDPRMASAVPASPDASARIPTGEAAASGTADRFTGMGADGGRV
ncbi:MAG: PspC domain-containing protein, partial [Microbacterium sp.]